MKKNIIAGNWKMNLNRFQVTTLLNNFLDKLPLETKTEIIFAPSFVHLSSVVETCAERDNIFISAQDCSANSNGPFTGEVSAEMIASCGAKYVILGHSERRAKFKETNELLKAKVGQALTNNLKVIFCCGESLIQRENGVHFEWIKSQISESLFHLTADEFKNIVIAYEPIWAIGTGVTASTEEAQNIHAFIRNLLTEKYAKDIAESTSILYGGSCKASNAKELFASKDVDGGLIGGASLNADSFVAITQSF